MILFTFCLAPRVEGQTCDCTDFPTYKCINSGLLSDLIGSNVLLGYGASPGTPQFIVVENYLNFYDALNSSPYYFASGSEIVLLQDAVLNIRKEVVMDNVNILGCGSWEKIQVFDNATFRLKNSDIANGCQAIVLSEGANAEIIDNRFVNNSVCIEASGNVILLGEGVAHNSFNKGTATLTCQTPNNEAVRLTNVPHIAIGNPSGTGTPNIFDGYTGISAQNSNVSVFNSFFYDKTTGAGIKLTTSGGVYTARMEGLAMAGNSRGIESKGYNLAVSDAILYECQNEHILIAPNNLPIALTLNNNSFEKYASKAISVGSNKFSRVYISENEFHDNHEFEVETFGIHCTSNEIVGTTPSAMVQNNTFFDQEKDNGIAPFAHHGIYLGFTSGMTLKDNDFIQNYAANEQHYFTGIRLFKSPNNKIQNNQFIGTYGPLTGTSILTDSYKGMNILESGANLISCNASYALNQGFRFQGPDCDQANFHHNTMEENLTGLYLSPGSIMGQQFERENSWSGDLPGDGIAEAHFDGNPDQQFTSMSLFSINSSNPTSDFWANPRIPEDDWFEDSQGQPSILADCYEVWPFPLPPSVSDDRVIGDEFEAYKDYPASEWEAILRAYGTLYHNADYRAGNGAAATFFALHDTANIGKLYRASLAWKTLGRMDSGFETDWSDNATAISLKLDTLTSLVAEMETADEADQDSLATILILLQEDVAALQTDNADLADQYVDMLAARADQLASDLEDITAVEVWEQNMKTVLTLLVERFQEDESVWSGAQYDTLLSIADQCRHEGGIGVVMARAAIEQYDYDDEIMCPGASQSRRVSTTTALQGSIAPNPAGDFFTIRLDRPVTGQVILRNMHGQPLRSITVTESAAIDLDTRLLSSGVYHISVQSTDGAQLLKRLSIIH
ncbi:MAG: T9SS type A sorting domain-containing protein [Saprospiraceae bacterium]|nr:T9SS type A sorting domain-containing protein [Saprospiraceae bacterium]